MQAVLKQTPGHQEDQAMVLWTTAEFKNSFHTWPNSGEKLKYEIELGPDWIDIFGICREDEKNDMYVRALLA